MSSTAIGNNLSPSIKCYENSSFCLLFKGCCLKQRRKKKDNPPNRMILLKCLWIRYMVTRFKLWEVMVLDSITVQNL